jgi:hypothetical protein
MSSIINQTADLFELKSVEKAQDGAETSTLLAEAGAWNSPSGKQSGVSVTVYGDLSPLLSTGEARKFAKWLLRAADELEGEARHADRRGQKKRRFDEDEE